MSQDEAKFKALPNYFRHFAYTLYPEGSEDGMNEITIPFWGNFWRVRNCMRGFELKMDEGPFSDANQGDWMDLASQYQDRNFFRTIAIRNPKGFANRVEVTLAKGVVGNDSLQIIQERENMIQVEASPWLDTMPEPYDLAGSSVGGAIVAPVKIANYCRQRQGLYIRPQDGAVCVLSKKFFEPGYTGTAPVHGAGIRIAEGQSLYLPTRAELWAYDVDETEASVFVDSLTYHSY